MADTKNYSRRDRGNSDERPINFKNGQPVYKKSTGTQDRPGGGYQKRSADKKPYSGANRSDDAAGGEKRGYSKSYSNDGSGEKRGYNKSYSNGETAEKRGYERSGGYANKGRGDYQQNSAPGRRSFDRPDDKSASLGAAATGADRAERAEGAEKPVDADELPYIIMGRNAVKEAVKSGRSIDRLLVNREQDGSLREIVNLARDRGVQIREVDKAKLDELCLPFGHGSRTGNHQGIVAQVPGVEYCEISDILAVAKERNEKPFVILLDGIEDPHNLGGIIRSAVCAGAHGVIIPKRRSAGVTSAACKASAGAVEYMKVARVANLSGAIQRLKDEGMWIAGADMGGTAMYKAKLEGAIGLVIGGEGGGISELVKKNCDFLVSIPMSGSIDSLNASVAAGVLMFEKKRQDG